MWAEPRSPFWACVWRGIGERPLLPSLPSPSWYSAYPPKGEWASLPSREGSTDQRRFLVVLRFAAGPWLGQRGCGEAKEEARAWRPPRARGVRAGQGVLFLRAFAGAWPWRAVIFNSVLWGFLKRRRLRSCPSPAGSWLQRGLGGPQPVQTHTATVPVVPRRMCGRRCRRGGGGAVSRALGAARAGRL